MVGRPDGYVLGSWRLGWNVADRDGSVVNDGWLLMGLHCRCTNGGELFSVSREDEGSDQTADDRNGFHFGEGRWFGVLISIDMSGEGGLPANTIGDPRLCGC